MPDRRSTRQPQRRRTTERPSARRVAQEVVHAVDMDDAYANLLLPARIREARLDAQDAGFATDLAYGTLRWQGQLDAVIAAAAGRPIGEIDPTTRSVLRIAVQQLARMRVPAHAAVHESIELLGDHRGRRGFANAVLRRVAATPVDAQVDALARTMSDDDALALRTGHPTWVLRAMRRALEAEDAGDELPALLAADNDAPRVQLVALPGLAEPEELGDEPTASPLGRLAPSGDPTLVPAVREGRARVQDAGSQLAALALTRAEPVVAGERWLDLCAGPGGKAALLAAEARMHGARLEANELVPTRAGLVRQALRAVDPTVEVAVGDGRRYADVDGVYDRILLDAPCTGLGALRRRPEARWRKQPSDVPELARLQSELLRAALRAVRPGGLVAYVTCSPHLAETRAIVQGAVVDGADPVDTRAVLARLAPGVALGGTGAAAQLWPHRDGTDAMFVQLLRRPGADGGTAEAR
ncbi:RsmB/NOP family class I SAM-dependent RNA methyltransferase [Agrococcus sp. SGAir0287]|uniref:RsmB/NOP family class I SAM-dependent RNA methyltransferase n=1 Tax=Agrococcus sp. SGAir0287 TaxID=2070347 RepID=UPI0010CD63B7|nr:transcription antitermination factor NusB [Agrococcus sp. SGAir0287]QCR19302.1 methyltransferase [Agrococcus sp. SGAir0287]